jgi:hypothetical protein
MGLGSTATQNTTAGLSTGAAIGSVIPVLGTAVGGAVGAVVGLVSGLFGGGKDKTGLPQIPSANGDFNNALATKWYTLYFPRYAPGGPQANAATQAAGIAYWAKQIAQDGPQRAWANFSTSAQPVADNVPAIAAAYTPQYGSQYVLAPPSAPPIGSFVSTQVAGAPTGGPAPLTASASPQQVAAAGALQASILPAGLSGTTLLIVGGGLFVGLLMMKKSPRASRGRPV